MTNMVSHAALLPRWANWSLPVLAEGSPHGNRKKVSFGFILDAPLLSFHDLPQLRHSIPAPRCVPPHDGLDLDRIQPSSLSSAREQLWWRSRLLTLLLSLHHLPLFQTQTHTLDANHTCVTLPRAKSSVWDKEFEMCRVLVKEGTLNLRSWIRADCVCVS